MNKLDELHPAFRPKVEAVIAGLEKLDWDPRIVWAYRTPEQQTICYTTGHSTVKFSFHMAHFPDGRPAALAADIIDRKYGYGPGQAARNFFADLARLAREQGCICGSDWNNNGIDDRVEKRKSIYDAAHIQMLPNSEKDKVEAGWLPEVPGV